ncbi:MAG TPA: glycosyltransferase family 2 protein, partial [Cytophagales bacterium]|nr:glycosyltransferase family 2 protein [Cytophagales bacterium]
ILAAAMGAVLLGKAHCEPVKRCYPYTSYKQLKEALDLFLWLRYNPQARRYVSQNANTKVQHYSHDNSRKKLLEITQLAQNTHPNIQRKKIDWNDELVHVSGIRHLDYEEDEVILYCFERNAKPYLSAFLKHYRSLGVRHFMMIDYGSTDGTLGLLQKQLDVTVYHTDQQHSNFEPEIRQALIRKHNKEHWCLNVKINELFEYPCSDKIPLKRLLQYLKSNNYSCVAAPVLEMFTDQPLLGGESQDQLCFYYDLSNVIKQDLYDIQLPRPQKDAVQPMENRHIGVRQQYVNSQHSKLLLVKHPLVFSEYFEDTAKGPSSSSKVRMADITCVLRHCHIDNLFTAHDDESQKSMSMVQFHHVNELVNQGFVSISSGYVMYVDKFFKSAEIVAL